MKKIISVIAVVLVLAALLASCSPKISGSYYSGDKNASKSYVEFDFSSKNVHISMYAMGIAIWQTDAEYTLNDDKTKITITVPDDAAESAKAYSGEFSFEEAEDYIKIGLIKYHKG